MIISETYDLLQRVEALSSTSESENVREAARGILWQIGTPANKNSRGIDSSVCSKYCSSGVVLVVLAVVSVVSVVSGWYFGFVCFLCALCCVVLCFGVVLWCVALCFGLLRCVLLVFAVVATLH